ncbi:MAG TPA: type II secretion system F family protein [Microbacterium sp.]|uniref:type II secretion system F family protein n=1 Tax=Microbacterium sp. TaxID=51671 RepID=UPI002B49BDF2|nr:type II secretion system F family protein [Microbacterium sp.]HKT57481.1 type II secretion system F family protein [Microbacterium sp.]
MRVTRRAQAAPDAATVRQLAVLLQAGIAPERAWRHLASLGAEPARSVTARMEADVPLTRAIAAAGPGWGEIAAAWTVATTVGAPLAASLRGIADTLQDAADIRDEVRVALTEPLTTTRLMSWLPVIGLGIGIALGFDSLRVLTTNPIGRGCLVAGVALIVAAQLWSRTLARRAEPPVGIPGLHADLLAIAVSGGVSLDRAQAIVARADPSGGAAHPDVDRILELSRTAGVPAADLLRADASLARHRARTEGRMAAARLSSRLLVPLALCTLPAFLLLGVAPMLLGIITTTVLPL